MIAGHNVVEESEETRSSGTVQQVHNSENGYRSERQDLGGRTRRRMNRREEANGIDE